MSAVLLLDKGNHSMKAALTRSGCIARRWRDVSGDQMGAVVEALDSCPPRAVVFSSVVPRWTGMLLEELSRRDIGCILPASTALKLPFALLVDSPERLGSDRLCAACGAIARGYTEAIVVDGGTAVTIDVLSEKGFHGGAIFPGLDLLRRSLHAGTAVLPDLSGQRRDIEPPGRSTEEALASGTAWGLRGAVRELVAVSRRSFTRDVAVVVTGGGMEMISSHLTGRVVREPDLIFFGLEHLYRLNRGSEECP